MNFLGQSLQKLEQRVREIDTQTQTDTTENNTTRSLVVTVMVVSLSAIIFVTLFADQSTFYLG